MIKVIKKSIDSIEKAYPNTESGIDNYGAFCDIRIRLITSHITLAKEKIKELEGDIVKAMKFVPFQRIHYVDAKQEEITKQKQFIKELEELIK